MSSTSKYTKTFSSTLSFSCKIRDHSGELVQVLEKRTCMSGKLTESKSCCQELITKNTITKSGDISKRKIEINLIKMVNF